ncbi:glycosyltransferase [Pseudoclavibacter sp. 8L]|uniref:glycosyltransferase n=1 Tax=Pseudoclavibacter sp. 8L TaxID=2653162 RepID=UPI0012F0F9FA|nr:glycosyltransferase [Pseudoclavibacter sp. 8L]VXC42523.1 conserved hypothetical protein [Pseudoclavibacter sp. 8L]
MTTRTHFFARSPETAREIVAWDPDSDPQRFAHGAGHNVFELFARLRDLGANVTIGPDIPGDADVVVAFATEFAFLKFAWVVAPFRLLMIRSDVSPAIDCPYTPTSVAVPNASSFWTERYGSASIYLPALPQRGLVARNTARDGITNVGLKANPGNIPDEILAPEFADRLREIGCALDIDAPADVDGSDQRWHDFSETDVTLCFRRSGEEALDLRKPPTKLVNAWSAGTIPITGDELAYRSLIRHGEDGFIVESARDVPAVVERLQHEPELRKRLLANIAERRDELSTERLTAAWSDLIDATARAPRSPFTTLLNRFRVGIAILRKRLRESP